MSSCLPFRLQTFSLSLTPRLECCAALWPLLGQGSAPGGRSARGTAQAAPVLGIPVPQVSAGLGSSCLPALEHPASARPPGGAAVPFCRQGKRGPECCPLKRRAGARACPPTHPCPGPSGLSKSPWLGTCFPLALQAPAQAAHHLEERRGSAVERRQRLQPPADHPQPHGQRRRLLRV